MVISCSLHTLKPLVYGPFLSLHAKLLISILETLQHLMILLDVIEDLSCVSEQTLTEISTFFLFFLSSSYRLENIIIALVGKIYHNFTFKVCSFHWCKIWIGFYYLAIYNQDFNSLEPLDMNKTGMEKRGLMVIHINYIPKI